MLYVKIVNDEDTIVDVLAIQYPNFCRLHSKYHDIIGCKEEEAEGLYDDDAVTIYKIPGKNALPGAVYTAIQITEPEYNDLASMIESADFEPVEEDVLPEEADSGLKIVSRSELIRQIAELKEGYELLEGCVLEISAILYS